MRARGLAPGKFANLPNGIDPDRILPDGPTSRSAIKAGELIDEWHAENRIVLIHPGAQGAPNALDLLLDTVAELKRQGHADRIGVLLVGGGKRTEALVVSQFEI